MTDVKQETKTEPQTTTEVTIVKPVAVAPASTMRPAVSLAYVQETKKERDALIRAALLEGKDYGVIPGTKRPTLYKPGAEQIAGWFECRPEYKVLSEEHDANVVNEFEKPVWENGRKTNKKVKSESRGLHAFRLECLLVHRPTGMVVGSGVGSCSTLEQKYVDRPNDLENTVLKMAKKRAFVDAVLTTFALSDRFTQDLEDMDIQEEPKGPPVHVGASSQKFKVEEKKDENPEIVMLRKAFAKTGLKATEIKQILIQVTGTDDSSKWTPENIEGLKQFLGAREADKEESPL